MIVALFSFDNGDGTYTDVTRDTVHPGLIESSAPISYASGQPPFPTYVDGDIVGRFCKGQNETQYTYVSYAPYATFTIISPSTYCGYVPPVCDLALVTLTHTDETGIGANDGTVRAFFTSADLPIRYTLIGSGLPVNETGYFTGLTPGIYKIDATNKNGLGCSLQYDVTILAYDASKTKEKYRLSFSSVQTGIQYQLRFLYQKAQFDPLVYPLQLTGTGTPIIRKTTNSNEDKTEAFAVSSLDINVYSNGIFQVSEFADAQERDWKVELYKKSKSPNTTSPFNGSLTENTSPSFVDGGLQLKNNGTIVYTINGTGTNTNTLPIGNPYSLEVFVQIAPTDPNAKIRMTVTRGSTVIYDRQIPAVVGNSLFKTGITQDANYTISVRTLITTATVTPIDIPDYNDPSYILDWQGWLLPDELQDFYADNVYSVAMKATDGLLSLKGSSFGDQSLYYTDAFGIKHLVQLFGLKQWGYLVKICLDQLGYDYGLTTILSSLSYQTFKGGEAWLNYATWADQFYDQDNQPKDTYSVLEILLKGMHLQIVQDKGCFVLWDINDASYQLKQDISAYAFKTDFTTISSGNVPINQPIGFQQINAPINQPQTLNYDKAFNVMEASVSFSLLSLLYPNPSFELNAVQGSLPDGLSQTTNMNAFDNYDPQDPLNPNVGAFSGDWDMRTIGRTPLLLDGFSNPVSQGSTGCLFVRDTTRVVHPTTAFSIDQTNKKLNMSFYWRPQKFSDTSNPCPRYSIFYTDSISGNSYMWTPNSKNEYQGTGWFLPAHNNCFIPLQDVVQDTTSPTYNAYLEWRNYSITTDKFPESGIGNVEVSIGTPLERPLSLSPALDKTIDYDAWVITLSDANDAYNFQTGEKHTVTNVTSFAKAEKKTVDLSLFSYPNNKRLGGNVAYGANYPTAKISNEWYFALSVEQVPDRLPANIIRRFAKNYQRPMYKFQGDISSDVANFYSVWLLSGYLNRVFIPFTLEMDLRNSVGNVVLIEDEDSQMQSSYQYLPIYEKSARNNLS